MRVTAYASTTRTNSTSLQQSLPIMLDILMVRSLFLSKPSLLVSPVLVPWISPYGIVGALEDLKHMHSHNLVSGMVIRSTSPPDPICESCILGKQRRHNIPKTATHCTQ